VVYFQADCPSKSIPARAPGAGAVLVVARLRIGWAGAPEAVRTAWRPARTAAHRTELIRRELAIAVFVQLLQSRRRIGDFLSGNDAIVIRVQSFFERTDGRPEPGTTRRSGARRRAVGSLTDAPKVERGQSS